MKAIKFGTDGWRGIIAQNFTFENVQKVSQAIADYIKVQKPINGCRRIVVGHDRRFLSNEYARCVCEVLAANGLKVLFTDKPTSTPAVTLAIKKRKLIAGVVVTASHNPANFNGIKFKTHKAVSAPKTVTQRIEKLALRATPKQMAFDEAQNKGFVKIVDIDADYVNFIKNYIDFNVIKKQAPSLLVDYMHGAGVGYIEKLLKNTKCKVTAIRDQIDPLFGGVNPEPVPKNLKKFLNAAKLKKPKLAMALDGDADRIGAAGANGEYLSSGQIISLILLHLLEYRGLKGIVIKTISGTKLIDRIAEAFGLELVETPIGFKYISSIMLEKDVLIGGEESGGIGFKGYIPERDGIVSGLFLLEMVAARGKSINKIMQDVDKRFGKLYYDREDYKLGAGLGVNVLNKLKKLPPSVILGKKVLEVKTYDGVKFILEDESWLLLRASGTEPVMRIYAESSKAKDVKGLLSAGKRMVFKCS